MSEKYVHGERSAGENVEKFVEAGRVNGRLQLYQLLPGKTVQHRGLGIPARLFQVASRASTVRQAHGGRAAPSGVPCVEHEFQESTWACKASCKAR